MTPVASTSAAAGWREWGGAVVLSTPLEGRNIGMCLKLGICTVGYLPVRYPKR